MTQVVSYLAMGLVLALLRNQKSLGRTMVKSSPVDLVELGCGHWVKTGNKNMDMSERNTDCGNITDCLAHMCHRSVAR